VVRLNARASRQKVLKLGEPTVRARGRDTDPADVLRLRHRNSSTHERPMALDVVFGESRDRAIAGQLADVLIADALGQTPRDLPLEIGAEVNIRTILDTTTCAGPGECSTSSATR
jgi:hypothetical protein